MGAGSSALVHYEREMGVRATVVLFDVDGTLITCGGAGRRAMERAFHEVCGRAEACDFPFDGGTDRAIARQGLRNAGVEPDAAKIEEVLARYLGHLEPLLASSPHYAMLPGVEPLLDAVSLVEGLAMGLGTGNVEVGARVKLRRAGLEARFAFGGFGCDHEVRARLLEAGARRGAARLGRAREAVRVVVVGDTPRDVEAAHAIGAECIAVATGSHDASALRSTGAALVVDDLRVTEVRSALLGA